MACRLLFVVDCCVLFVVWCLLYVVRRRFCLLLL